MGADGQGAQVFDCSCGTGDSVRCLCRKAAVCAQAELWGTLGSVGGQRVDRVAVEVARWDRNCVSTPRTSPQAIELTMDPRFQLSTRVVCVHIVYTPVTHPMQPKVVGIREFREKLAEFLLHSDRPIAVTRHGTTVGYYIPARATQADAQRSALRQAAAQVDRMLARAGFTEADLEEVVREFDTLRKRKRK